MGIVGAYATAYVAHIITPGRPDSGASTRLQPVVYVYEYHKEPFLCLHYCERVVVLWLYGERRFGRVGTSSTNAVVSSSVLILFSDVFLTQLFKLTRHLFLIGINKDDRS